jgi:hypothetical protein
MLKCQRIQEVTDGVNVLELSDVLVNLVQQLVEGGRDLHDRAWPLGVEALEERTDEVTQEQELFLRTDG